MSAKPRSEVRDGMRIDWDVDIAMDDGLVLKADVFRPIEDGRYPVILSYGPYAKGLAFQDGYPSAWIAVLEGEPFGIRAVAQDHGIAAVLDWPEHVRLEHE